MFKTLLVFIFLFTLEYSIAEAQEIPQSDTAECTHALQNNYPLESEQTMKRYSKSYIEGLDNTNVNLKLAQLLRTQSINPHTTHIQEFSDLIDRHIAFVEQGINSQEANDKTHRLKLLEKFKSEAQFRKTSKEVTYRWWVNFNFRLSILATSRENLNFGYFGKWTTNEALEELYVILKKKKRKNILLEKTGNTGEIILELVNLLNSFPKAVLIPTKHSLGIIPINKTYGTGVHLIGLNNKPTRADGILMQPNEFFLHDIEHTLYRDIDNSQFLTHLKRKLRNLKKPQREAVEYIYFELTHESVVVLKDLKDITHIRNIIIGEVVIRPNPQSFDNILMFIPNNLRRNHNGIDRFTQRGGTAFLKLISDVNKELASIDNE